jgi:hypothetical protein
MDHQIEALDERLASDPEWQNARARLDDRLFMESLTASKQICNFFAHEEEPSDRAFELAWGSLESQILHFFRELDWTGVSRIIGEVAPDYLRDFSFRNALQFRNYEENLLKDLDIPEAAWERFWPIVDKHKSEWLSDIDTGDRPYSIYQHLSGRVVEVFRSGPGPYEHLSPFKWWKPVVAGLGSVLGIADGILVPATGGIAITSFVASVAASVVTTIDFEKKT